MSRADPEEWLEMAGTDRYLISTHGRILDVVRNRLVGTRMAWPNNRMRATVKYRGQGGRGRQVSVATAVLDTFDPAPATVTDPMVTAFHDGDVRNCRLVNLYRVARADTDAMAEARARIAAFEAGDTPAETPTPAAASVHFQTAGTSTGPAQPPGPVLDLAPGPEPESAPSAGRSGARPGGLVTAEALEAARAGRRTHADLDPNEKAAVRAWWVERGGSTRGRIPTDAIAAWDASKPALTRVT